MASTCCMSSIQVSEVSAQFWRHLLAKETIKAQSRKKNEALTGDGTRDRDWSAEDRESTKFDVQSEAVLTKNTEVFWKQQNNQTEIWYQEQSDRIKNRENSANIRRHAGALYHDLHLGSIHLWA